MARSHTWVDQKVRRLIHTDRQPMARRECFLLFLRAGNVVTQCVNWLRCVNIGSCTTRVFVTPCSVTFVIRDGCTPTRQIDDLVAAASSSGTGRSRKGPNLESKADAEMW
jgi:hypothetical protein